MVCLDDRVEKIKKEYVDEGSYFIINKGRQYGKTTTLKALGKCLEQQPFFESMVRQLEEYPEMKRILKAVLFLGKRVSYNPDISAINLAAMFGYIINAGGSIQVANRIFEMRLYNLFLAEEELSNAIYDKAQGNKSDFAVNAKSWAELLQTQFKNNKGN